MNPYSHLVVASKVEPSLAPENPPDYYWGAVAPDIRYVAGMRRHQTHLPAQTIMELIPQYPHLESFVQGYLIHCLTDEIELETLLYAHLPFSLLKRRLSRQHLVAILEFFYLEHENVNLEIANPYNAVLGGLGIHESDCTRFANGVNRYITHASFDASIAELAQLFGLEDDHRIEKYVGAARSFQQKRLLKRALFLGIRASRITEILASQVSTRLQAFWH